MTRSSQVPLWKHLRAILVLPVMVLVVIPAVILRHAGSARFCCGLQFPYAIVPAAGALLSTAFGLRWMVLTIRLFARRGEGTLAPWDVTRRLVVQGPYRHVRNPMITGVFCVLLGEVLLFGSSRLLAWLVLFACINCLYIPLVEEPSLVRRFGEEYLRYCRHVPRWIPRREPWQADTD